MNSAGWLLLVVVPLTGCGASLFETANGYDRQRCVEEAMRNKPDASLVKAASAEFELACRGKEGAACSALGVTYELGLGQKQDLSLARALYAKACTLKNQRGCVNFANLQLSENRSPRDVAHAHELLLSACEAAELSGCASMAERLVKGIGVPKDVEMGGRMFEKGCEGGNARACFGQAELARAKNPEDQTAFLSLFAKSCVAGYEPACRQLNAPLTRLASR